MADIVAAGMICQVHKVTEGSMEIGLEGQAAMKAVFAETDPKVDAPCFDILTDIWRKIKALPIKVSVRHIEGHQDKHKAL